MDRLASLRGFDSTRRRDNLSLCSVQIGGLVRVDFYHWLRDACKSGLAMRVKLDDQQRFKYSVSNSLGEPPINLETKLSQNQATWIDPDIGVPMSKTFRFPAPSHALKLKDMWNAALGCSFGVSCSFCNSSSFAIEPVLKCVLCSVSMHASCGAFVSAQIDLGEFGHIDVSPPAELTAVPSWWNPRLCKLCSKAVHCM